MVFHFSDFFNKIFLSSNAGGWLLFLFNFLLVYLYCKKENQLSICFALFIIFILHQAVVLINVFITPTFGANGDALSFHKVAIEIVHNQGNWAFGIGGQFYRYFLAFFYKLLGQSLLVGGELSIFAFMTSCIIFLKIYKFLGYVKYQPFLIILYGCTPSMILLGSVTLRESWQILFLMIAIYYGLKCLRKNNYKNWFCFMVSSLGLSLFHAGLIIYILLLSIILMIFQYIKIFSKSNKWLYWKNLFPLMQTCFFAFLIVIFISLFSQEDPELRAFRAMTKGHSLEYIKTYRSNAIAIKARANYDFSNSTKSNKDFILKFFKIFTEFMLAPFPWQINNFLDLYASAEAIFRFVLILIALLAMNRVESDQKMALLFVFVSYLNLSILWSLGTANYGTSLRHHMVGYWVLVMILGFYLNQKNPRKIISMASISTRLNPHKSSI